MVAAADVAHGREAARKRVAEHAHGVRGAVGLAERLDALHRHVAREGVHVRVDQAGHQRAPADIDDARLRRGDRLRGDALDQPVGDEDVDALGAVGRLAVEDAGVGEQDLLRHGRLRLRDGRARFSPQRPAACRRRTRIACRQRTAKSITIMPGSRCRYSAWTLSP